MALFHQIKRHDPLEEYRRSQERALDDGRGLNPPRVGLTLNHKGLPEDPEDLIYGQIPREEIERLKSETRGRKPDPNAKKLLTLRLDPDVIEHFKSGGEGWQTRMNEALRKAAGLPSLPS